MSKTPPRVTVHSTEPDQGQVSVSQAPGTAVDSSGRRIGVKPLDPLQVYRLAKIMGASADSEFTRGYAALAACVRTIDGEPIAFPNSDREIEAMMNLLGSEGLEAVNVALGEMIADRVAKPAARNPEKN